MPHEDFPSSKQTKPTPFNEQILSLYLKRQKKWFDLLVALTPTTIIILMLMIILLFCKGV
jgi:hypothetical protein